MLQLYNTLAGKKEPFKPIDPSGKEVRLYTCGPTVYNCAHIGNLRAYVFADVLRRTLEYSGYTVKHVMNITDVGQLTSDADEGEDKMMKALKREGKPLTLEAMGEIADKYTAAFLDDLNALNILLPQEIPRASEHIKEDIELIQRLEQKGFAYKTSDGIYFDISQFPEYGTRSGFKLGDLKEGARVAVNAEKRNPRDFALWKFSTNDIGARPSGSTALGWESPWGKGFPGWHLECSAMVERYLGKPFNTHTIDIHTGGIDHIPTHHQNEIAQSEAAYGVPLARFWMHNEYLTVPSGKMAKSGENFLTLQTLTDRGIHPLAYRYYLLQAHYRSPIAFSWEALEAAQDAYYKLLHKFSELSTEGHTPRVSPMRLEILKAVGDDLNTSRILSDMWVGLRNPMQGFRERDIVLDYDLVLGLDIENQSKKLAEEMNAVPEDIRKIVSAREDARRQKDFKSSDDLREEIQKEGFEVMDTDSGPVIRKKIV